MTDDELRAQVTSEIERLEAIKERTRHALRGSLGTRNDPVDSYSRGEINGQLKAYRDVLARLPGVVRAG